MGISHGCLVHGGRVRYTGFHDMSKIPTERFEEQEGISSQATCPAGEPPVAPAPWHLLSPVLAAAAGTPLAGLTGNQIREALARKRR